MTDKGAARRPRQAQAIMRMAAGERRDMRVRRWAAAQHRAMRATVRRERAIARWAAEDNGPGDYERNGPDRVVPEP